MKEESAYAHGLLMYGYDRLPYQTTSVSDIATDDAVSNQLSNSLLLMATGSWAADNNPMSQWNERKDAIQYINKFLTIVDEAKWAPSSSSKNQMFIDRLKGEAYALRALHYYYLLQAHAGYADDGVLYGVPLLLLPEDASSDFNQPRATFADCIKQMFEDCDNAIALLPLDYKDISSLDEIPQKYISLGAEEGGYKAVFGATSTGLISGRIAEGIKAQIAYFAASPAYRDQSGVTSEQAAKMCADVLKRVGGVEGIDPMGHIWYSSQNKVALEAKAPEMAEILWRAPRSKDDSGQESANFPPTLYGKGNINPSQNLVDAFPMRNGRPITDAQSGYNSQNPYAGRDPRLANYVIYNGQTFRRKQIATGSYPIDLENKNNDNRNDNLNYISGKSTRTGYYLKKLLRDDVSVDPSSTLGQYHLYPRIRYTEIFLAYAETANEAWGPTGDGGNGYSAYDVIKAIRQRAGLATNEVGLALAEGDVYLDECAADKEKMTQLIRNERRIELCFENKRFWDLRRWKMPLDEPIRGINWTSDTEFEEITVEERKYDNSYMWYGPLPKTEVLKWSKLMQNKGWN